MEVTVARAPLRISLGGGGTDLPSWYRRFGGLVVSAAIDRHVHVVASPGFHPHYVLKHLEHEEVESAESVAHPILRAALLRHGDGRPLELASVADVPPGTGLGSSGAYTVCVLKALRPELAGAALAEEACEIEIGVLERAVGKQDQYAASLGGLCAYTFAPDDTVEVRRLDPPPEVRRALRDELLLFYTGDRRSASEILAHQVGRTLAGDAGVERNLARSAELARSAAALLETGELDALAELMDEQWEIKRARAPGAVTPAIDELRELARRSGARWAQLMGAGGGGFLLVHAPQPESTRRAMTEAGAPELRFDLEEHGCLLLAPAPAR